MLPPEISLPQSYRMQKGVSVRDVHAEAFIAAYSEHLKTVEKFELPKWHDIVKTGVHKEHAPYDPDWFYTRAASLARKIYLRPGLGVGALQRVYGGSKNSQRGVKRARFCKSSSNIIRTALHQLEAIGVVERDTKGGRKVTSQGMRDLDRIALQIARKNSA